MKPAEQLRADFLKASEVKSYRTQAELAKALGVSPQYLADVLKGRRGLTPKMLNKGADIFAIGATRKRRWHQLGAIESGWEIA